MKVDEFVSAVKTASSKVKPASVRVKHVPAAVVAVSEIAPDVPVTTTEAKAASTENIYGIIAEPGHELHRIRQHRPDVWHKIKNWD